MIVVAWLLWLSGVIASGVVSHPLARGLASAAIGLGAYSIGFHMGFGVHP